MSVEQTELVLETLHRHVVDSYENGEPALVQVRGRPNARILDLEKPTFERYGVLINRGPRVIGQYVVRSLLCSYDNEDLGHSVMLVVEAQKDLYGYIVNEPEQLEELAAKVGAHPMHFFSIDEGL